MSRKQIAGAVAVVVLLAGVAGLYAWWSGRNDAPEFRFGKTERGSITAAVSATGTVNPVTAVQVGSQVSGQIKELFADFNSEVKKGQVIARIDSDSFRLRVNQAMADLDAARATVLTQRANVSALQAELSRSRVNYRDAERELKRNQELFEKNFVSASALDKAKATYDAAREQVNTAQAQLAAGQAQVTNVEALVKQREAQLAQARVPAPEALGRRADEIAGELKLRGTAASLLLLTALEAAAREALREIQPAVPSAPAAR